MKGTLFNIWYKVWQVLRVWKPRELKIVLIHAVMEDATRQNGCFLSANRSMRTTTSPCTTTATGWPRGRSTKMMTDKPNLESSKVSGIQMKLQMLDGSDPIIVLSVLPASQVAQDADGINEWSTMLFFHSLIKNPAAAALNANKWLSSSNLMHQKGKGTSFRLLSIFHLKCKML